MGVVGCVPLLDKRAQTPLDEFKCVGGVAVDVVAARVRHGTLLSGLGSEDTQTTAYRVSHLEGPTIV